jgi:hypothetical protein
VTHYGTWVSYGGSARIWLAIVLLAVAGGLAYAGTRLPLPVGPARPGRVAVISMLVAWVLAIATFLVGVSVYVLQERHVMAHVAHTAPTDPITPVTLIGVGATFFIILISSSQGPGTRLAGAVIGALAAPMVFELPFDLIIMARIYPPVPPDPALYRALFFLPLFLIEITTLSLLAFSALVKLRRPTFFSLALMFIVFAAWSLAGFGYPSTPLLIALNAAAKILAFVVTLSLFLPSRAPASPREELEIAAAAGPVRP